MSRIFFATLVMLWTKNGFKIVILIWIAELIELIRYFQNNFICVYFAAIFLSYTISYLACLFRLSLSNKRENDEKWFFMTNDITRGKVYERSNFALNKCRRFYKLHQTEIFCQRRKTGDMKRNNVIPTCWSYRWWQSHYSQERFHTSSPISLK